MIDIHRNIHHPHTHTNSKFKTFPFLHWLSWKNISIIMITRSEEWILCDVLRVLWGMTDSWAQRVHIHQASFNHHTLFRLNLHEVVYLSEKKLSMCLFMCSEFQYRINTFDDVSLFDITAILRRVYTLLWRSKKLIWIKIVIKQKVKND